MRVLRVMPLVGLSLGCNTPSTGGEEASGEEPAAGEPREERPSECVPAAETDLWLPEPTAGVVCDDGEAALGPEELDAELDALNGITAEELVAAHTPAFATLGYDPLGADLSLIQATGLALTDDELARLGADGFVILPRLSSPTFGYAYETIYALDLPVFISADSMLHAVHRSFGAILKAIEVKVFVPALERWLTSVRNQLACSPPIAGQAASDLDLFVTIPASLLAGAALEPAAGASAEDIANIVEQIEAAKGQGGLSLFGEVSKLDYSQFQVRGHYAGDPLLEGYFRAMMWLGTVGIPLMAPDQETESLLFSRRGVDAAVLLLATSGPAERADLSAIHDAISSVMGPADDMTLPEVGLLLGDLGIDSIAEYAALDDAALTAALEAGGYGNQKIASGIHLAGLPLARTVRVFGQRYVADSDILSSVVYDRVESEPKRLMPSPLDVAFATLGNGQAATLLAPELVAHEGGPDSPHPYAEALAKARVRSEAAGCVLWDGSLYHTWLGSLRELSPPSPPEEWTGGLPEVAKTERWGRRLLGAQLASWAELRYDTILYAKQSYTGEDSCEFPDGYVDPYPGFYRALQELAERGRDLAATLQHESIGQGIDNYFIELGSVAAQLEAIAHHQLQGLTLTEEQLAFINQSVKEERQCGKLLGLTGWYGGLFFDPLDAIEPEPTIADVHTQPQDEQLKDVGHVLHAGTGMPRMMVMTANTCTGPRAYVGPVSSYYEVITEDYKRLTREEWEEMLADGVPEPSWMSEVIGD